MSGMAGASRMSSVRGLNDRPHTAIVLFLSEPKCASSFDDEAHFLRFVDALDGLQRLKVVALVAGELDERLDVFRKAAAAESDARKQERRPDAPIGADRLAHLIDVRAERFADVRHLVHEGDARGENRVRRVLAQLGAGEVHHHDRRAGARERRIQLDHQLARAIVFDADDDAIGLEEILDRRPLLQKLRVADDAERMRWSRAVITSRTRAAVPTGTVLLSTITL